MVENSHIHPPNSIYMNKYLYRVFSKLTKEKSNMESNLLHNTASGLSYIFFRKETSFETRLH